MARFIAKDGSGKSFHADQWTGTIKLRDKLVKKGFTRLEDFDPKTGERSIKIAGGIIPVPLNTYLLYPGRKSGKVVTLHPTFFESNFKLID